VFVIQKPQEKKSLGKSICSWEVNHKMDFGGINCQNMKFIELS